MTWATFRARRQPGALSVAGLADLEAQLHLGLRLRALDLGAARLGRILDVVSRTWLATLTSPEETSPQVQTAFRAALEAEGLPELADELATAALREAIASGYRD
jgi:hypothetical protein